jgi:hypothetical protein
MISQVNDYFRIFHAVKKFHDGTASTATHRFGQVGDSLLNFIPC